MMFKRCAVALGGLLTIGAASPATMAVDSAAANRVHATVQFLADDLLEGRDTGSRGHEIAAAYVASQFQALGLQPGGENGGWFQRVPLRTASLNGPAAAWLNGQPLAIGQDISVRPSIVQQQQDVTAPLVFVGYGIDAPQIGVTDYRGLDLTGKIAVALDGTPDGLNTEIAAHLGSYKAQMAAKAGALGLVTIPAQVEPSARQRSAGAPRPVTNWVDTAGRNGGVPASLRVTASMTGTGASKLFAGASRSYAQLLAEAARKGARPAGFALPGKLRISRTSSWRDFTSPEVIGVLPGSDPALRGEYVVLMGHLDHLGMRPDPKPGEHAVNNGALDNAAGVATMLETARSFTASGRRPRRSVMFIANTGEEKGLLGADYFAAHPTVAAERIAALVDLDMPLPLYDFTDVIPFGAEHSTVAKVVARAGASMGIAVARDPMPEESIFVRSDHYRFVLRGVPAILLMTGWSNGGQPVWQNFLKNVYHSPRDNLLQPIRWDQLAKYAELNYRISRDLADAAERPRWYQGDFFGDSFAPGQPRAAR
ncbi:M20/M25/M40 family metallo-hydrolase [Sphingomonas ginkgonis]|nr:M20/M25/M40 family metallo-hydrolase [Sphingomonas ginkgonis]